jgi:uncharacterized Zn-finger protein
MESKASEQNNHSAERTAGRIQNITDKDLPLVCPLPGNSQWDAHPRVFLTLDEQGKAVCPYCGTTYVKGATE